MQKKCFKCGRILSLDDFYSHPATKDKHLNKCKDCTKKDATQRRRNDFEKVRDYESKRAKTEKRRQAHKFYNKKYRNEHPERNRQYLKVARAIRRGEIVRPESCSVCGRIAKTMAHHLDYSDTFNVIFVCQSCHRRIHDGTLEIK